VRSREENFSLKVRMYYSWNRAVIGNEYILALAIAVSGAVIALLSLPSRYCLRLPSPPEQETHRISRAIRTTLSVLAVGCGLPIDLFELLMAWATLLGDRHLLPWWPIWKRLRGVNGFRDPLQLRRRRAGLYSARKFFQLTELAT
jgi:hypothetical protein